ncbi:hypothetical protein FRB93_009284 [Tulasnella sp. JGI-2019a]|nr:hypothetical protein FRB93_009284 [Tulasnella sp. JGI-2019a]
MPSILPNELVSAIIEGFGESETSLSYRLPKESVTILITLCHVNHTFKALTEPVLYSQAIVTPVNIEAFTYAVLRPDASSEPDQPLQTRYVSGKAPVM